MSSSRTRAEVEHDPCLSTVPATPRPAWTGARHGTGERSSRAVRLAVRVFRRVVEECGWDGDVPGRGI